jgi:hypothetical protein
MLSFSTLGRKVLSLGVIVVTICSVITLGNFITVNGYGVIQTVFSAEVVLVY